MTITAALSGLGNIAWRYDARNPASAFSLSQAGAMRGHPGVSLIAGASPDAGDRSGFAEWSGQTATFASLEEMLERTAPQLVGICSPTFLHYEQARLCLEKGVRLLWLEKPPTVTLEELRDLAALAESREAAVCVNYFRRYLPVYVRARSMLAANELGRCRLLRILYSPGLARNGIHLLDQIFFLTGEQAYEIVWRESGQEPDSPSFALRLPSGMRVLASGADLPYHTNDISAVCDEGVISILRGGKKAVLERRVENALFPGCYDLADVPGVFEQEAGLANYMDNALADLVASHFAGRPPCSNLSSAYLAQSLLEDLLRKEEQ